MNCIGLAENGIHAVLVVLSLKSRFSREEKDSVRYLLKFFGTKISDYMIVVFTGGDELEEDEVALEDYLGQHCPEPLKVHCSFNCLFTLQYTRPFATCFVSYE